jgi:flagellar motor switch/type III secretory pathway protein FliN
MKVVLDVVIGRAKCTLKELQEMHHGSLINIEDFIQSEVYLKSGTQVIATGTLTRMNDQYLVLIDTINERNIESV